MFSWGMEALILSAGFWSGTLKDSRTSYGVSAVLGTVAGAEDALGDAFVAALRHWPVDGIPQKPEAWLLQVARNRLIDAARRHRVRQESAKVLQDFAEEAQAAAARHGPFPDERLKLLLFVRIRPLTRRPGRR
jgi:predicted RNA polymerase sigma factor